jgi:hypothetical protein
MSVPWAAQVEKLSPQGGSLTGRPIQPVAVAGNRSLDEFGAGEDEGADGERNTDPDIAAPAEADAEASPDGIEPIAETFAWSATGTECGFCGETVTTRWRNGETLVCEDCKAW